MARSEPLRAPGGARVSRRPAAPSGTGRIPPVLRRGNKDRPPGRPRAEWNDDPRYRRDATTETDAAHAPTAARTLAARGRVRARGQAPEGDAETEAGGSKPEDEGPHE